MTSLNSQASAVPPPPPLTEAEAALLLQLEALRQEIFAAPAEVEAKVRRLLIGQQSRPSPSPEVLAQIYLVLASCSFELDEFGVMLGRSQEALRQSRQQFPVLEARALNNIGLVHQYTGDLVQAVSYLIESLQLAEKHSDLEGQCRALQNLAQVQTTLKEYHAALQLYEQVMLLARACKQTAYLGAAQTGRLEALYCLKEYERALDLAPEALDYVRQHRLVRFECTVRRIMTLVLLQLGRPRVAWMHVTKGRKLAAQTENAEALALLEGLAGRVLLALDKPQQAKGCLESALERARKLECACVQKEAHADLALLYEQAGDYASAYGQLVQEREVQRGMLRQEAQHRTQQLAIRAQLETYSRERARAALGLSPQPSEWSEWAEEVLEQEQQAGRQRRSYNDQPPENFDPLTGMVNREFFHERVQKALALMDIGEQLGLVFVAIDDLPSVLTLHGQAVADAVLKEVASRLEDQLRSGDLIGRMSQSEFMVMLGHLAHAGDLRFVTDKLLVALREPMRLQVEGQDLTLQLTPSLGGVVAPQDGQRIETLYRHADLALREVQQAGGGSALRFQPYMSAEEQQKRTLEFEMRGAAERGELCLHYQAQLSLQAEWGRPLTGYEALVRWNHPRLGLVSPAQFIPLAEESHLILDIGRWVLREACEQAARWGFNERGLSMSVNVSALQLGQADFVQIVQGILQETGLRGECLTLELTESMLHDDEVGAAQTLRELEALGIQVALDDFGTGYSSLSMLQKMPFHVLKIDRSFLNDLSQSLPRFSRAWTLMEVLVRLAHNLQMKVVVEGIESEEQWDLLHALGCDTAQGYWLSRPLPPRQAELLL